MYCDGVKLIKINKRQHKNALFANKYASHDSSSDTSSDASDVEIPSQKGIQFFKERTSAQYNGKLLKTSKNGGNLLQNWENGGPIKLLRSQGDEAEGYLFFKNYKKLDYDKLKDLVLDSGCTFLSMKEQDNDYIKVRLKTEGDVKLLYNYLKKDSNYDVTVLLDTEDFHNKIIKEKQIKKLAKFKCKTVCTNLFKTHEDLLSDVAAANKLEADIRFEVPKGAVFRKKSKIRPKDPIDRKIQLENISRSRSKSPIIGTWNGHFVVMPKILPPIHSERPCVSKLCEEINGLEDSNSTQKSVYQGDNNSTCFTDPVKQCPLDKSFVEQKSPLKSGEDLVKEQNTIKKVIKQNDILTENKSKKLNKKSPYPHKSRRNCHHSLSNDSSSSLSEMNHSSSHINEKSTDDSYQQSTNSLRNKFNYNYSTSNSEEHKSPFSSSGVGKSSPVRDESLIPPVEPSLQDSGGHISNQHPSKHYKNDSNKPSNKYFPAGYDSSTSSDEVEINPLREGSPEKSRDSSGNSNFREMIPHNEYFPAKCDLSASPGVGYESFTSAKKLGRSSPQGEESPDENLISVFDLIASLIRRRVYDSLETSFRIRNGS